MPTLSMTTLAINSLALIAGALAGQAPTMACQHIGNAIQSSPVSNTYLFPDQCLVSPGGAYVATMQGDGNLVVYSSYSGTAIWNSGTAGNPGAALAMQQDGNVVIYANLYYPSSYVWQSNTPRQPFSYYALRMQDDGNLVAYRIWGNRYYPVWSWKTGRTS
ncbi:MAG: hypothetical protein ACKVQA_23915 [Burkholderiales bacterium]